MERLVLAVMANVDRVEIVQFGSLSVQYGESAVFPVKRRMNVYQTKKDLGVCGESSITLVQTEGTTILVDTGFREENNVSPENLASNARHVTGALSAHGVDPDEVQEIFITHWHHDHFGNLILFPNAVVRFAGIPKEDVTRVLKSYEILNTVAEVRPEEKWHSGLAVLPTPGHNRHHHSVVINFNDLVIVAAGDAIVSQSYYDHGAVWTLNSDFQSEETAIASMNRIREVADIIIPGHGHPFENYLRLR
jgi:glyoxylase-like metal-dependent hydrolase (beta-lactamase superfamily II)